MWDKGSIWPENIATPEPNTEKVCRMGTLGIWPNSLNTEGPRLADKESYTQITELNTTDTVAEKEWGWGLRIRGETRRNGGASRFQMRTESATED